MREHVIWVRCQRCGRLNPVKIQWREGWAPGPLLASEWAERYEASGTCDYRSVRREAA